MAATLEELERRSRVVLEGAQRENAETLKWAAGTLGKVSSVQDTHTVRLNKIDGDLTELKTDVAGLKTDVAELKTTVGSVVAKLGVLTDSLPGMMRDTMREVLAEQRKGDEGK